jgi:TetR/AcrR family transcriptional repressor of mexJK operon
MPSRRPSRRPTREESAEVDELVRKAAIATFLERGFDGTSMDAVARAAGVTRATLYARYPDKRALFKDVIGWALKERQLESAPSTVPDGSLRDSLVSIGRAALARAVDPETVRLSMLLMTESSRFPDRVPKAHEFARYPHMQPVIDVLRRHQATGSVEVRDVELAAEQFLTMVASHPARLAAFGIRRLAEEDERYLEHAVDLFIDGVRVR